MSAESLPVVELQETIAAPEISEVQTVIDPEQAFADHVRLVSEQGDAVSTRSILSPLTMARRVASVAAIGITGINADTPRLGPLIVAGAVSFGYMVARDSKDVQAARTRMQQDTQEAIGERYELFQRKAGKEAESAGRTDNYVSLFWNGPIEKPGEQLDLSDRVAQMALRAKRTGIASITMDKALASAVHPDMDGIGRELPLGKWVKRWGGVNILDDQPVISASPDLWLNKLREVRLKESTESVSGLVERLAAAQPDHPFVKIGRDYAKDPAFRDEKLRGVVRRDIHERYLTNTERLASSGQKMPGYHGASRGFKSHSEGKINTSLDVDQFVSGQYERTVSLAHALGIKEEEIAGIIENPDLNPQLTAKVVSYLLLNKLEAKTVNTKAEGTDANKEAVEPAQLPEPLYIQQALMGWRTKGVEPLQTIRQTAFRTWAAVGGIAIGLVGPALIDTNADKQYDKVAVELRERIKVERGLQPTDIVGDDEIHSVINRAKPVLGAWKSFDNVRDSIAKALPGSDVGSKEKTADHYTPSSSSLISYVGDLNPNERNVIEWRLDAHNMEASGYWAYASSSTLQGDRSTKDGALISWKFDTNSAEDVYVDVPPTLPAGVSEWIEGSRPITHRDYLSVNGDKSESYLPIPVLDGTKPIAANISGQTLTIVERTAGTYAVHINPGATFPEGKLTYWVAPSPGAEGPKSIGQEYKGTIAYDEDGVDALWNKTIPGLEIPYTRKRTQEITDYLRATTTYDLEPLNGINEKTRWITNTTEYEKMLIDNRKLNCNVALAALALESRWLAGAFGYHNNAGQGSIILSSHENHAWAVDGSGTDYDATPGNAPAAQAAFLAAFFDEEKLLHPPAPEDPGPTWPLTALGLSIAAALALSQRKSAQKAVTLARAQVGKASQNQLQKTDPETLKLAVELANQAAYAPQIDVAKATDRVRFVKAGKQELIDKLNRPDLHQRAAQRGIRSAAKHAPVAQRQLASKAAQAIGRGRRGARR